MGGMVLVAAPSAYAHGGPPVQLQDVQVTIRVLPNGDLDITERVQANAAEASSVYWPVGGKLAGEVSGVMVVSASSPEVRNSVEVDQSDVGWLVGAGVSTVTLRYRVAGAVNGVDGKAQLRWDAVPVDRDEAIGIAKVMVQLPQVFDRTTLTTDLVTALANDNTQHRVLSGQTMYFEGRDLKPQTTLTVVARWPAAGQSTIRLSTTQLGLIQPLVILLLCALGLWWGYRRRRSKRQGS